MSWKKAALLALVAAAIAAFFLLGGPRWLSLETLRENREALRAFTDENYVPVLVGAVALYAVATALSFPGAALLTLTVGFLFGRWVGTAAAAVAATAGATGAFLGARYLFADAVRRRMGPRLQRIAEEFRRDALSYLFFLRLVPVFPFWLVNLALAFTHVHARTFVAATFVGILPGTFVYVYLGESLASIDRPGDLLSANVIVALTLLGVLSLVPVLVRKLRTLPTGADA